MVGLKGLKLSVSFGKGGLILESLSLWLKSPKKMPNVANDFPEHYLGCQRLGELQVSRSRNKIVELKLLPKNE